MLCWKIVLLEIAHVSIGKNGKISNSILKNSILQNNVSVENALIHNSMIGNNATFIGHVKDISLGDYSTIN